MAAGRNCLILIFPVLTTLAALILTLIVLLGNVSNTVVLRDVYFLKVNISDLSIPTAELGLTGDLATVADAAPKAIAQQAGLHEYYTTGLWNYCAGNSTNGTDFTIDYCSKPASMYYLDPVNMLSQDISRTHSSVSSATLATALESAFPTEINDYISIVKPVSNAMWILYIVGICLTFIAIFVGGIFSFHSRCGSFCTGLISALSSISLIVASGIATAMFTKIRNLFNENANSFGIGASVGRQAMILTWVAVLCSLASTLFWMLSICCGSTKRREVLTEEKEPFIGYVGHQ
ncbi:hypothetical protein NADFUDRAFT_45163 [Nadsonia fulvescens var. elongata DSM 6958]|uniref:Integral membrane protein n=1 Tax=Nadsonia fulvescens var. elongata DSM 6958 TaxID=857566 RepID=A0A1E3PTL8_9ASCO|nr:hypothetical protein NADFUDRAFT_45163 [Nadsonia fulvescens var. elongata DSM 6958]